MAMNAMATRFLLVLALLLVLLSSSNAASLRSRSRDAPSPFDRYASFAGNPPIAQVRADDDKRARNPFLDDPLNDVLVVNQVPPTDQYLTAVKKMLTDEINFGTVKWLDSANKRDRDTLAHIILYCTNVFASRGTDRDCIIQCHPKVDCGLQAARECQPFKDNYEQFVQCTDAEGKFCNKFGQFSGDKYPAFRPQGDSEEDKIESLIDYCANIFQFRGVKLPCLRDCTIFQLKEKDPDHYYMWKAKRRYESHRLLGTPGHFKDPTELDDPERGMLECDKEALRLCQNLQRDYWRECYERIKLQCTQRIGQWNYLVGH